MEGVQWKRTSGPLSIKAGLSRETPCLTLDRVNESKQVATLEIMI